MNSLLFEIRFSQAQSNQGREFSATLFNHALEKIRETEGFISRELCQGMKNLAAFLAGQTTVCIPGVIEMRRGLISCFASNDLWNAILAEARNGPLCLRLRIVEKTGEKNIDADAWPWEIVFSNLSNVCVTRVVKKAKPGPPTISFAKLKVRLCFSRDEDIAPHYKPLRKALSGIDSIILEECNPASPQDVIKGLDGPGAPHVIHIVGHGGVGPRGGYVSMHNGIGLTDGMLAESLERREDGSLPETRMVIFSSCTAARIFGKTLQEVGMAAILGFQGEISKEYSAQRLIDFYTELSRDADLSIPQAVNRILRWTKEPEQLIPDVARDLIRQGDEAVESLGRSLPILYLAPGTTWMRSDDETSLVEEYLDRLGFLLRETRSIGDRNYDASRCYAHPRLMEEKKAEKGKPERDQAAGGRSETFEDFANRFINFRGKNFILVKGPPGRGKSELAAALVRTVLQRIRQHLGKQRKNDRIPIPVLLLPESAGGKAASLPELIRSGLGIEERKDYQDLLAGYCKKPMPGVLLVVDALDESENTGRVLKDKDHAPYVGLKSVMATCREAEISGIEMPDKSLVFVLEGLEGEKDITEFVMRHWNKDVPSSHEISRHILADGRLKNLCMEPLFLKYYLWIAEKEEIERIPRNKDAVYDILVKRLLERVWREKGIKKKERKTATEIAMRALQAAALEETRAKGSIENFAAGQTLEQAIIRAIKQDATEVSRNYIQEEVLRKSGVMYAAGGGDRFLLRSVFEFFLGRAIAAMQEDDLWNELESHVYDPQWEEVIVLAAYRLAAGPDPMILLRHLDNMSEPLDWAGHWARLFCRCASVSWESLDKAYRTRCVDLLCDHSKSVIRRESIKGLCESSQFHSPEIREMFFERLADDDGQVKDAAAEALSSRAYDPEARQALMEGLADDDLWVRAAAVKALSSQAYDPEVRQALMERLVDDDDFVRYVAAKALYSQAHDPEVRQALMERLADDDWWVRAAAAEALSSQAHDAEVRQALMERLAHDDGSVRTAAYELLSSQAHNPEVRQALMERLADDDGGVRAAAVEALSSQAHDAEVRQTLMERLADDDVWVRAAAAKSLSSQAHDPEVRQALMERLTYDDGWVRASVARALSSQAHDPEVRQALMERLADDDWSVSFTAAEALSSQAHDPEVRETIISICDRVDHSGYIFAFTTISNFTDEEDVPGSLIAAVGRDSLAREGPILPLLNGEFIWRKTGKKVKIKS